MENDFKKEARKQFIHYFRIWFIVLGILAVVCILVTAGSRLGRWIGSSGNHSASEERVYDEADVLSDEEEERLRAYIAEKESKYRIHLVLVTINEDVESSGYWDTVMMNKADNFYDEQNYGFDKVHGDGVLLLDNWYKDERGSQQGSWLSTCGRVYERFSETDINTVLNRVGTYVEEDPYRAYKAYVDSVCGRLEDYEKVSLPISVIILVPIIVAVVFALVNLRIAPAKDTTNASTYVSGGTPKMKASSDDFIRKNVTSVRVQSSSSGGGRSGGHGGGHRSSGGISHGGGGRRR